MPFVNLENLTLIGPGSEWFWTAISGVVVAATFLVIYRQLASQRSASLYEQSAAWGREWNDDTFALTRLQVLVDLDGRPVARGLPYTFGDVGDYFERLGYLVAHRHVRAEDVWNDLRPIIGLWWAIAEPFLQQTRAEEGQPRLLEHFEKLEKTMRVMDQRKLGKPLTFDGSNEARRLHIDLTTRRLRRIANARNGIFPALPEHAERSDTEPSHD